MGVCLDGLEAAISWVGAIKQARIRELQLSRADDLPSFDPAKVFCVSGKATVTSSEDGMGFRAGDLIDTSLIPVNTLRRLARVRAVEVAA
jgi:hypothetical protein